MRLLVAGASGRTGRLLVRRALDAGHTVTALVRDVAHLPWPDERLRLVVGDVLTPETLPRAVAGQDAVISVLAPRPRLDGRVYIEGTRNLADAAALAGVRRFVAVSAEGAGVDPGTLPLIYRVVMRIPVVARLYPDIARMEQELAARTDLDWTIVAAAVLTNWPYHTGAYRVSASPVVQHGLYLPRADLAALLLAIVVNGSHVRERIAAAH